MGVPDVGAFEYGGVATILANISTRAFVQTGDNVMIGGFIVQGTEPKRVIIRAIGPELTQYGVPNALANPHWNCTMAPGFDRLQRQLGDYDHRRDYHQQSSPRDPEQWSRPGDGRESAIIADLPAGNYTAIVPGINNTTGVALAEVYDLNADANSNLGNISTRAFVQTGDNVMIGGFIVQGTAAKRVIVRAIGPSICTPFNVPNALTNPTLELHDSSGALIASNDNWQQTIIGGISPPIKFAISGTAATLLATQGIGDHRGAASGQLHCDRARRKRYHRRCSGRSVRSALLSPYVPTNSN